MDYAAVESVVAAIGLICRGGFHPRPEDGVPGDAATIVLVGNAGPSMWRAFARARRDEADPLDAWCRRVLTEAAGVLDADVLFPFGGPPFLPFQRWAQRAEAVHPSPLGILIHPDFGLWHGYRGALVFARRLALPARDRRPSPCTTCDDKPCLTACPVGAFADDGFDAAACAGHVTSDRGGDCLDLGCRARRACPVGRDYRYEPDQARHHMDGFLGARRAAGRR